MGETSYYKRCFAGLEQKVKEESDLRESDHVILSRKIIIDMLLSLEKTLVVYKKGKR